MYEMKVYEKSGSVDGLPLLTLLKDQEILDQITLELGFSYHQMVLQLADYALKLSNQKDMVCLVLSDEDGGFARYGYVVEEDAKRVVKAHAPYIELVLDKEGLMNGDFHIFSHELGHIITKMLLGEMAYQRNNKQHTSVGVTDFFTAFDEGFSIQFERLAYDHVDKYFRKTNEKYIPKTHSMSYWQCDADSQMRLFGVKDGRHMYRKAKLDSYDHLSKEDLVLQNHVSPVFDKTNIKSSQELLASEGFIAYMFYQIIKDKELQDSYQSLIREEASNINILSEYVTLMKVTNLMKTIKNELTDDVSPILLLINKWREIYPDDARRIVEIFIRLTSGITIDHSNMQRVNKMAYDGMMGNAMAIREHYNYQENLYKEYINRVLEGTLAFDKMVKSPLWMEKDSVTVPECFWMPENRRTLNIDLHQADIYELSIYFDVSIMQAKDLQRARDENGFANLEDYYRHIEGFCNINDI